ncbi:hypothetical protein [Amycolatopsis sacchari]|uniref:Uncharacterized protein n=1 Tax=Amycolatopsis sacchari TaxID=115433 RepID=A0A1I3MXC0_9PSEU|nr:hypothetical protein [Amycolatopsis sacchari]SFJ01611.1 hypothetical protein SAMN05421835_102511 [Amycolatopsis sacchari]
MIKKIVRYLIVLGGVAVFLTAAILLPAGLSGGSIDWLWLAIVILVGIPGLALYSYLFHAKKFREQPLKPFEKNRQVAASRSRELQNLASLSKRLTLTQAQVFAIGIVRPAQINQRLVERYTPDRRTLRCSVSVDVNIPKRLLHSTEPQRVYLPAIIAKKGELHDDLMMKNKVGEPITWLSYREYVTFVAEVLHLLLLASYGLARGTNLPDDARTAEEVSLRTIVNRNLDKETADYSGVDLLSKLIPNNNKPRDLAILLVRRLVTHYAITALIDINPSTPTRYSYEHILIPRVKMTGPKNKRKSWSLFGALRIGLGARPVEITIDIDKSAACKSYHLHLDCPDDVYLARQRVFGLEAAVNRRAEDSPSLPQCRFRRRLGQSHAHFYCRYMPQFKENEQPQIRFDYFEVPPGSMLRAAIAAVACAAIVWTVGLLVSRYANPDTDAPAFFLAFPALAATWLGFDPRGNRLLEGTLSARVCLIATAVLSITASGLFIAHKSAQTDDWAKLPEAVSFLGIHYVDWAIVTAIACLNALQSVYKTCIRTWEYSILLTKPHG